MVNLLVSLIKKRPVTNISKMRKKITLHITQKIKERYYKQFYEHNLKNLEEMNICLIE